MSDNVLAAKPILERFRLDGRVALVTGGGQGIGRAFAHALGEAGAKVMISARKSSELEQAVAELKAAGIDAHWMAANCADQHDLQSLGAHALQTFGHVDVLLNNAGAAWGAPAEDHPIDGWDKVMNLNVRGYFILSQYIGKHSMIPRRSGSIINVSSITGLGGNPTGINTIAYNTSKAAVINFSCALAGEWGVHNIRVNSICPGFFPSKMTAGTFETYGEDVLISHAPLRRLGDDEDLKGITVLYASDAGKHITGQWLAVDGGVSCITGG